MGAGDLPLLEQCLADPAMTVHLGGPESVQKIAERQARYERPGSKQFKIVDEAREQGVGWVGYWERDANRAPVYEIGWAVIPAFQGRGIAGAADPRGDRPGEVGARPPVPARLPRSRERPLERRLPEA